MSLTKKMRIKQTLQEFEKEDAEIKMQQSLVPYDVWLKNLKY